MNKSDRKDLGIFGTIAVLIIIVIFGVLLMGQAEEQKDDTSQEGYEVTKGLGNMFFWFGLLALLILIIIGGLIILKKVGIL